MVYASASCVYLRSGSPIWRITLQATSSVNNINTMELPRVMCASVCARNRRRRKNQLTYCVRWIPRRVEARSKTIVDRRRPFHTLCAGLVVRRSLFFGCLCFLVCVSRCTTGPLICHFSCTLHVSIIMYSHRIDANVLFRSYIFHVSFALHLRCFFRRLFFSSLFWFIMPHANKDIETGKTLSP